MADMAYVLWMKDGDILSPSEDYLFLLVFALCCLCAASCVTSGSAHQWHCGSIQCVIFVSGTAMSLFSLLQNLTVLCKSAYYFCCKYMYTCQHWEQVEEANVHFYESVVLLMQKLHFLISLGG